MQRFLPSESLQVRTFAEMQVPHQGQGAYQSLKLIFASNPLPTEHITGFSYRCELV